MEWNRSMSHYLGSRIFWILGAIANGVKLHSLIGLAQVRIALLRLYLETNLPSPVVDIH